MATDAKLAWGILGSARVCERLLPAIVSAGNAELVAIASRRSGAAAQTVQKYAPTAQNVVMYDDLQALLDDARVQAVYLPMANHEHAHWALQAIARGKHVLIEKPMAIRAADVEAIYQAAQLKGVTVMEGFMYRFHPQFRRIQDLVASGLIGEVRYAKSSYSFMLRPERLYRLQHGVDMGGGAMWDVGPYAVHSLRQWFSERPQSVLASAKWADNGADIAASGIIDFGGGKRGHFDISFECSRQSEYTLIGSKGGIKCHKVWQLPGTADVPVISWWTEDGRRADEVYAPSNHFVLEVEHFSDCVLNRRATLLTAEDALMNCRTIEALLASAVSGQREVV
jgi:D-xylose 1-dehydrogenase (NADP+, D-xylono-1,5-lactone-forming)